MIVTQHNDNLRTGYNPVETVLTTSNVSNPNLFGKVFERSVDGSIYAQPLIVPDLTLPGQRRPLDVMFVATMHNSVYAFDVTLPGANIPLWHRHLVNSIQLPALDVGDSDYRDMIWEVGIVGTPVIDTDRGALYVVTTSRADGKNGVAIHQLWKLNIMDGSTLIETPIAAKFRDHTFISSKQLQRPALALANNKAYIAFASYGDKHPPYHGWILAYDADNLQQTNVFSATGSGTEAGIWQAGQGPAVDEQGNIYVMTGNGDFNPPGGDYGDSVVKLDPNLNVLDYFSPYNTVALNNLDLDLGSGGILLIPNTNLCTGGGKEAILYLMDRSNLGKHSATHDAVLQKVSVAPRLDHHIHGSPTYYLGPNGVRLYVWPERENLMSYAFSDERLTANPVSTSKISTPDNVAGGNQGMPGGFLSVSSNGTTPGTGIVWANHPFTGDASHQVKPGILRAFDAEDLTHELWDSRMEPTRDDFGNFAKFCCPIVQDGRVYQATMGGLQQRQQTQQHTNGTPAFANQNDERLIVAWSGTDNPAHLNIMISPDGLTWDPTTKFTILAEHTPHSPGLAYDATTNTTFIAWTGTDPGHHLNIMSSTAAPLNTWANKHTTPERSDHGAALAFGGGHLFVAWTGTNDHVNVASTTDGGATWVVKTELPERSNAKPNLLFHTATNTLFLTWQGTDNRLNIRACTDLAALDFGGKTIIGEHSPAPPAIEFDSDGLPWLSWNGTDPHLNMMVADGGSVGEFADDPNHKRIFYEDLSGAGPAMCWFQGRMAYSWQSNDDRKWLNLGVLSRGSVVVYGLLPS